MMIPIYQRRDKIKGFAEIIEAAKSKNPEKKLSRKEKKKEQLLRKKLKKDPEQYREKFGQCPRGYVWDDKTQKCKLSDISKTEPEVKDKPPEQKPQREKKITKKPATEKPPESYRPPPTEPAKEKKPEEIRREKRKQDKAPEDPEEKPEPRKKTTEKPKDRWSPDDDDDDDLDPYGLGPTKMSPEQKEQARQKALKRQLIKQRQEAPEKSREIKKQRWEKSGDDRTMENLRKKDPERYLKVVNKQIDQGKIPDDATMDNIWESDPDLYTKVVTKLADKGKDLDSKTFERLQDRDPDLRRKIVDNLLAKGKFPDADTLDMVWNKDPKQYSRAVDKMRETGNLPDFKTAKHLVNLASAQDKVYDIKSRPPETWSGDEKKMVEDFGKTLPTDPQEIEKLSKQWSAQKFHEERIWKGTMEDLKQYEQDVEKALEDGKPPPVLDAKQLILTAERRYGRSAADENDKAVLEKYGKSGDLLAIMHKPAAQYKPGSTKSKLQSWWQKLLKKMKPIGPSPWENKRPKASVGSTVMKKKIVALLDEVAAELDHRKAVTVASLVDSVATNLTNAAFGDLTPSTFAPLNGKQVVCMLEHKSTPVLAALHGKIEIEKNSFAFEIIGQGGNRMAFPWTKPSKASHDGEQYFLHYEDLVWRISLA